MSLFIFEKYTFKIDSNNFIPLSEFAESLFDNDVASLAMILTEPPDNILFKKQNIIHNIKSKKIEIPPEPMFPHITHSIVWQGGIHKDSFKTYVEIMRKLINQSNTWFEKFVDDYNDEVKKRFSKD